MSDARTPQERLNTPSMLLLVLAGFGLISALGGLISASPNGLPPEMRAQFEQMMSQQNHSADTRDFFDAWFKFMGVVMRYAWWANLISIPFSAVMLFGAWRMRQLRSWGLAVTAGILCILPVSGSCCCIGIPAGIWVLRLLFTPDIRAAFVRREANHPT